MTDNSTHMAKQHSDVIEKIAVNAKNCDIVDILRTQYAHLSENEVRAILQQVHAKVWTNEELLVDFEVSHFDPPYVHVIRKEDGLRGTVMFIDSPRFYFSFSSGDDNE